jgi:transposase InsO family protein
MAQLLLSSIDSRAEQKLRSRSEESVRGGGDYRLKQAEPLPGVLRGPAGQGDETRNGASELARKIATIMLIARSEELQHALAEFRKRYNQRWIAQRLGYVTLAQAHQQFLALGAAACNRLNAVSTKSAVKHRKHIIARSCTKSHSL